jgi:hypothetical protein
MAGISGSRVIRKVADDRPAALISSARAESNRRRAMGPHSRHEAVQAEVAQSQSRAVFDSQLIEIIGKIRLALIQDSLAV